MKGNNMSDKQTPPAWPNNCTPTRPQQLTSPVVLIDHELVSYADFVAGLFKCKETHAASLIHAAVGAAGEAGELLDALKKHWVYNKPLDRENVIEELGDMQFYMMAVQLLLGITSQDILQAHVKKLSIRYPGRTYTDTAAIARADKQ
jgi:NTP pyrophosphatase (non-canonical NTP hydrolase)